MVGEGDAADYFVALPIPYVYELQCLHEAQVHIWRWLRELSAREELRRAVFVLLTLIQLFQPRPLILRHFLKVVRILEDVKVVHNVKLLVSHLENIK